MDPANRQTDQPTNKQTNRGKNSTFLVEVAINDKPWNSNNKVVNDRTRPREMQFLKWRQKF